MAKREGNGQGRDRITQEKEHPRGGVILPGPRGIWARARPPAEAPGPTFEIEVSGAIGVLRDSAGVNLERVHVARVPGHHHVVPLVVIDWFV